MLVINRTEKGLRNKASASEMCVHGCMVIERLLFRLGGAKDQEYRAGMAAQWGSWTHTDNSTMKQHRQKGRWGGDGKKRGQKGFLELGLKNVCDLARLHADRGKSGQGPQELMSQNQ